MIDLEAIRRKVAQLSGQKKSSANWRPEMPKGTGDSTEYTVRVLSFKDNDGQPFKELYFYYNIAAYGILSPKQFGKEDPVQDVIDELRKEGTAASLELAKQLYPRMKCFVPIIVRGDEASGVKLWLCSRNTYQDLLNFMIDPEVGDFTDPKTGTDLKVKFTKSQKRFKDKDVFDVRADLKRSSSPLSKDEEQIVKWLDSIPDPVGQYDQKTTEELHKLVKDWLSADEPDEKSEGTTRGGSTDAKTSGDVATDLDKAFDELQA